MMTNTSTTTTRHDAWKRWPSDAGRYWATRTTPYTPAQEDAGCALTVDADTLEELEQRIDAQERLAQEAATVPTTDEPHDEATAPAPARPTGFTAPPLSVLGAIPGFSSISYGVIGTVPSADSGS